MGTHVARLRTPPASCEQFPARKQEGGQMRDTVTLISANPRHRRRHRRNPQTARVAGMKLTLPRLNEFVGLALGGTWASISPSLISGLFGRWFSGMGPMSRGLITVGGATVVSALLTPVVKGFSKDPKMGTTWVYGFGLVHGLQLLHVVSGGRIGMPTSLSLAPPASSAFSNLLPGATAPAAVSGPRVGLPTLGGRPVGAIPAQSDALRVPEL